MPLKVAPERCFGLPGLVVILRQKRKVYLLESIKEKAVDLNYQKDFSKAISEDENLNLYIDV